jgi:hypothetical protein
VFIYIIIVICVKKSSAEKIPAAGQGGSWAAVEVFIKVRLSPEFGKGGKRGQKKRGAPLVPNSPRLFESEISGSIHQRDGQKEKVFY